MILSGLGDGLMDNRLIFQDEKGSDQNNDSNDNHVFLQM